MSRDDPARLGGPCAAKGSFPYPHRTVAEVDAICREWERRFGLPNEDRKAIDEGSE